MHSDERVARMVLCKEMGNSFQITLCDRGAAGRPEAVGCEWQVSGSYLWSCV